MQRMRRLFPVAALICAAALALPPARASAAPARPLVPAAPAPARATASMVADIAPGGASSDPRDLTAVGATLFFTASDGTHGRQLWATDGTAAGTVMLTDVPGGADPEDLTAADGTLFFSATDAKHGRELWTSDGTPAGTALVADIVPGPAGSGPQDITDAVVQSFPPPTQVLVYFAAATPAAGQQLWKSDGTAAGTVMVTDVNAPAGLRPEDIAANVGNAALFSGDDGVHGREPWITDGTTAGTSMFSDVNPGPASSNPVHITGADFVLQGIAGFPLWYFSAADGTHGRELFTAYQGLPPAVVTDLNPGPASSDPGTFDPVAEETGLIPADDGTHGRELILLAEPKGLPISGPVPPATSLAADINAGAASSNPVPGPASVISADVNSDFSFDRTFISAADGSHGRELWQIDDDFAVSVGSEGGSPNISVQDARLVSDIAPGPAGSDPRDLVTVGGVAANPSVGEDGGTELFTAADAAHGRELWISDGFAASTAPVADINPGPASSDPADLTVIGQTAFFSASDGTHGRELWKVTVPVSPMAELIGPDPSLLTPGASTVTTGTAATFTVTLPQGPGLPVPSGTVTFFQDGTRIGAAPLAAGGSAPPGTVQASVTITAAQGAHNVIAVYGGDGSYLPATSEDWQYTGTAATSG